MFECGCKWTVGLAATVRPPRSGRR